jgi:hypothetical protein
MKLESMWGSAVMVSCRVQVWNLVMVTLLLVTFKWAVLPMFLRNALPLNTSKMIQNNEGKGLLKVSAGQGKTLNITQY